jgi:pimeloyl-ACP methyl ester carboxylesterase
MSPRWLVLVLSLAAALLACSRETSARLVPASSHAAEPTPAPTAAQPRARDVTFTTTDGVTIGATLHVAPRIDAPAVILVHQVGSSRAEWAPLLPHLEAEPALTTLAIDLRGHGSSTRGPSGNLDWQTFDGAAWAASRNDVLAAVSFLQGPDSGVAPASIAAVGASIGCSAVIAAAAEQPRIATMVTISPGRAYHGFDAIAPALNFQDRAIFAIASADETDSTETAQAYGRITSIPALIVPGDSHGVVIFGTSPETLDRVEDFLREHLAWSRLAPRAPTAASPPPPTSLGVPAPPS